MVGDNKGRKKNKNNKKRIKIKETIITSNEGYKNENIINVLNINPFNSPPPPSLYLSLFKTKKMVEKIFQNNKYNIEDILRYNHTNKNI